MMDFKDAAGEPDRAVTSPVPPAENADRREGRGPACNRGFEVLALTKVGTTKIDPQIVGTPMNFQARRPASFGAASASRRRQVHSADFSVAAGWQQPLELVASEAVSAGR